MGEVFTKKRSDLNFSNTEKIVANHRRKGRHVRQKEPKDAPPKTLSAFGRRCTILLLLFPPLRGLLKVSLKGDLIIISQLESIYWIWQ